MAYCLLGLFDINMPLLYGEGDKAFHRLQLEISRQSDDETLFAWEGQCRFQAMLAPHPAAFAHAGNIESITIPDPNNYTGGPDATECERLEPYPFGIKSYTITNKGLDVTCFERSTQFPDDAENVYTVLNLKCWHKDRKSARIQVFLWRPWHSRGYYRLRTLGPLPSNPFLLERLIQLPDSQPMEEQRLHVRHCRDSPWDTSLAIPVNLRFVSTYKFPPEFHEWVQALELVSVDA